MADKHSSSPGAVVTGANNIEAYFTETEAANLLRLSRRTLQRWRQEGQGLPFRRFGGLVRYAASDIHAWAAGQTRQSTSDQSAA